MRVIEGFHGATQGNCHEIGIGVADGGCVARGDGGAVGHTWVSDTQVLVVCFKQLELDTSLPLLHCVSV